MSRVSVMGAGALVAALALTSSPLGLDERPYSETQRKRDAERRNTPKPTDPEVETRQMRRARERAERKGQ